MAYGLDVPIIIAAAVALAIGTVVALIMLLRGPAKKPTSRGGKDGKKSSSSSSTPTKKPTTTKKDSSKKVATTTPKKAATPKTEKKKSEKDNKKATAVKPSKVEKPTTVVPGTSAAPESPKAEPALTKTEKKKQAKKAAKAVVAEVREETSAEDLEFARTMSNNAKGVLGGKKKEVEAEEAEEPVQQGGVRNWAEINAKNSEVQKYKAKVKENEKEITDLRRIIDENKKKMREYNLTNAKLVTDRNTQKEQYEEKIARLKADIEARRDNREVAVKGGDALRDRNYVVNVLQQERDSYKNQYADLQAAFGDLQKQFQKLSEGDSEKVVQGLQQQLDTISLEHNKVVKALQDAKQAEAVALEELQAERVNVARLTDLLASASSSGKEHAAAVEDTNGKEGDEQAST